MNTFKNKKQTAAVKDLCLEIGIPFDSRDWITCRHGRVRNTVNFRRYEVDATGRNVYSTESTTGSSMPEPWPKSE